MKRAGFTRQERTFIALMRIWAIAFLVAGIVFAAAPDYLLTYVTDVGRVIFGWPSPPSQLGQERFWLVLAVSLLFALAYLCAIVQQSPVRHAGYARIVIFSKLVSSVGFAACLLLHERQFFYLSGVVVDGAMCLITWRVYARAMRSRT